MTKIAFITSRFPYPLNKGDKLRVFHQIKGLSQKDEIHLISINDQKIHPKHFTEVEAYCASIHSFVLPIFKRIISLSFSFFKKIPLQVAYFYNRKIDNAIQRVINDIEPDYIHCHLIRTTEYVKNISNIKKSLDFMDAFGLGMEKREKNESNPLKRLLFKYEKDLLYKYESNAFDYVDQYCIISRQDQMSIKHPDNDKIKIVANGVDFDKFYPRDQDKRYDLLFMGVMNYPPNIEAVTFLVEKIMPLVFKNRPNTSLLIAGIGVTRKVKSYANSQIIIIEHFDDISDSIALSSIMLAPMLISIGLQNKIIQAMAMKVPCIISSSSNNAIGAIHNNSVIEADTVKDFAREILTLINDTEKRKKIAENAFLFVKNKYSWENQNEKLRKLIVN